MIEPGHPSPPVARQCALVGINRSTWHGPRQGEGALNLTLAELAAKHGVHHTMIASWKRQAIDGMAGTFSGAGDAAKVISESEVEKLHAKIGQLVVERDFLAKAFGR